VNAPLVEVLLDDARLADVAHALFELSVVDASISRLIVRRLIRAAPPPEVPAQIARSAPFAAVVLFQTPDDPALAAACARLRAEHDRTLQTAGKLSEATAFERALSDLDDAAFKLPTIEAVVADPHSFGSGERLRFPHPRLTAALAAHRIGVETMDFKAACRTYNILVSEDRRVIAAILL